MQTTTGRWAFPVHRTAQKLSDPGHWANDWRTAVEADIAALLPRAGAPAGPDVLEVRRLLSEMVDLPSETAPTKANPLTAIRVLVAPAPDLRTTANLAAGLDTVNGIAGAAIAIATGLAAVRAAPWPPKEAVGSRVSLASAPAPIE